MGKATARLFVGLSAMFQIGVSLVFASNVVYLSRRGMDLFDFSLLAAVFWSIQVLANIPAGAIADVFGRKRAFVLATAICSLGMFQYSRATGFLGCAAAETLLSFGFAFAGGSFQAWLVDSLNGSGAGREVSGALSKQQQALAVSNLVGSLVGVHLAAQDDRAPWIAGGIVFVSTSILAAMTMRERRGPVGNLDPRKTFCTCVGKIRCGAAQVRTNRTLRTIMTLGGMQFLAIQAMNMQWQPHFLKMVPDATWLGYVFACGAAASILGAAASYRAVRLSGGRSRLIMLSQIGVGLTLAATAMPGNVAVAVVFFAMNQFGRGLFLPAKDAWLNDTIGADDRATVLSFESTSRSVGIIVGLIVWGLIAKHGSIEAAWIASGGTLAVTTIAVAALSRRA